MLGAQPKGGVGGGGEPTLQVISGIFKDCKINHLWSCNFASKSKKLPDNEHFALKRTIGLIRFQWVTDILMVKEKH